MTTKRRKFSIEFKKKVVLEALKERETIEVLAKKYELQPSQISLWKSEALSNFEQVFSKKSKSKDVPAVDLHGLYAQIGQQKVEIDFLKKKLQ
jgi:transposase-like protein